MPISDSITRAAGSQRGYTARGYAWRRTRTRLAAHPVASSVSLLVLGIVLALPVLLSFLAMALDDHRGDGDRAVTLTAYLETSVNDLDGAALASRIAARPDVQTTRYISRDEALATFEAESDLGDALDLLEENPLPGAIVITPEHAVVARDRMQALSDEFLGLSEIVEVRYDLQWVERLQAVVSLLRVAAVLVTGFLTLTALLVIANTIRLELLARRAEREVCHLLGASRSFVNRPFLYTGVLYGLVGGVLAAAMAVVAFGLLKAPADTLAGLYGVDQGIAWPELSRVAAVPLLGAALGLAAAVTTLYSAAPGANVTNS